jgi:hypothetical protein
MNVKTPSHILSLLFCYGYVPWALRSFLRRGMITERKEMTIIFIKGGSMSARTVKARWALFIVTVFLSAALCNLALVGCATTAPGKTTLGPGSPDEAQNQHYEMLKSAIEAKSKNDALAALALLQADISRWQINWLQVATAYMDVAGLTDAVNSEDWDLANKKFKDVNKKYRGK